MFKRASKVNRLIVIFIMAALLCASILCGLYWFRVPVVKAIAPHYLGQDTKIDCLDFSLGWEPVLSIESLCLSHSNGELKLSRATLKDANFDHANRLYIKSIELTHKQNEQPSTSQDEATTEPFSLPESLPKITLDGLTIHSYLLAKPVKLRIDVPNRKSIQISGDLDASLSYQNQKIGAQITWQPSQLIQFNQAFEQLIMELASKWQLLPLLSKKIVSEVHFDGQQLHSTHTIGWLNQYRHQDCHLKYQVSGVAQLAADIQPLQANLDISKLAVELDLQQCESSLPAPLPELVQHLSVAVPKPINLNAEGFAIEQLALTVSPLADAPSIQISQIAGNYEGELSAQVGLEQVFNLSQLQTAKQAFSGSLRIVASGEMMRKDERINGSFKAVQWSIEDAQYQPLRLKQGQGEFDLSLSQIDAMQWQVEQTGSFALSNIAIQGDMVFPQYTGKYTVQGTLSDAIKMNLSTKSSPFSVKGAAAKSLATQLDGHWSAQSGIQINGASTLSEVKYQQFTLKELDIEHQITNQFDQADLIGNHPFTFSNGLVGYAFHQGDALRLTIPDQPINALQKWASQFDSQLTLVAGQIGLSMSWDKAKSSLRGQLKLSEGSFRYDDYQVLNLAIDEPITLNSAGLQLSRGKLTAQEINVGVPMTEVTGILTIKDNIAKLDSGNARVVGGNFSIKNFYLDGREQTANLKIDSMDLAKLGELHNQEGIEISGQVSGSLPIHISSQVTTVNDGLLENDGPGKLTITNNAGFDAIKAQEKRLSYLENVEFKKLSSSVSLAPDGWLDLQISIAGRNPQQNQEVIFNYGHKENIFVLLKALRVTNSIQNSIEKRLKSAISKKGKTP